MSNKYSIKSLLKNDFCIILIYIVLSILSAIVIIKPGFILVGGDMYFHLQRIYELRSDFINGSLINYVSMNMFNQSGSAVMSFYPSINLVPIVIISFIFNKFFEIYYISFILRNLLSFMICYYSCFYYTKRRKQSFIFSVTYTLSTVTMYHALFNYDLGISSSILFLPLVLFGLLSMIKENDFIEFSIGMSLIVMSHVISSMISISFILIFCIFSYKKFIDRKFIRSFLYASAIIILVTSVFWIPFLTLSFKNSISMPPAPSFIEVISFNDLLNNITGLSVNPSLTIWAVFGIILSVVNYKKMSFTGRNIFWVAVVFLIICSNFFPWNILSSTFIKGTLQFSWRFYIIPQLLLVYLFSINSVEIIKKKKFNKLIYTILILAAIMIQIIGQKEFIDSNKGNSQLVSPYSGEYSINIKNENQFHNLIMGNRDGLIDYYPKEAVKSYYFIKNDLATYDLNKTIKVENNSNGKYSFVSSENVKSLELPILHYNGIDYEIYVDGKRVKANVTKNALFEISNVKKGKHNVKVAIHRTKLDVVSYVTTIIGLILLGWCLLKKYFLTNRSK